jgi:hypothetical protein
MWSELTGESKLAMIEARRRSFTAGSAQLIGILVEGCNLWLLW